MNDENLANDLEYLADRTHGIPGDVERAKTLRAAAARLRALQGEVRSLQNKAAAAQFELDEVQKRIVNVCAALA